MLKARLAKPLIGALLGLLLLGSAAVALQSAGLPQHSEDGAAIPSIAPMLERVMPAVVNISTRSQLPASASPLHRDPFFRRFFDTPEGPRERDGQSLGSGVIVDAERGYILTNYHVVEQAQDIVVTLNDRRTVKARLVGGDPETDVAMVKIAADHLTALPFGDSDALRVGDFVAAIGNPFGLGQTVTSGIVSALGRSGLGIEGYEDFIQTDASINPGNSGGPLVNLRGELVGLNAAILTPGGGNIGIGFAIPSNMAHAVMRQLVEYGQVRRGRLGIIVQDLTPDLASSSGHHGQGALVTRFERGSSAAKSGMKVGDIIIAINDLPVRSAAELRNRIALHRLGERVRLDVLRGKRPLQIDAVLAAPRQARHDGAQLDPRLAGAALSVISTATGSAVQVVDVRDGSTSQYAGLRRGDIIHAVNRMLVQDLGSLSRALRRSPRQLMIDVQRGQTNLVVLVR
jgi:serine protease Do/serine protease DegQ